MGPTSDRVLIVIPAYNEEASLGSTLQELSTKLPEMDFLVVDDGSVDSTSRIAEEYGAKLAKLPVNLGVGGAMRFGFKFALQNNYTAVIQFDADGQHNPEFIPKLITQLSKFDLVIGARFAGVGDYSVRGPRRWAMSLLSFAVSRTAKTQLTDTTSGFRASGINAIALFAEDYPAEYLGDTVESLVIALRNGLKATQVPVAMRKRAAGQPSQSAWKSTGFLIRALFALLIAYIRPKNKKVGNK